MVGDKAGISITVWGGSPPEANALWKSSDVQRIWAAVLLVWQPCKMLPSENAEKPVPAIRGTQSKK